LEIRKQQRTKDKKIKRRKNNQMYQMQELNILVFSSSIYRIAGRAAPLAFVLRGFNAFCFIGFKRRALRT
jgi:hypothetical protein